MADPRAEMNLTPLIDVLLVLIVIFLSAVTLTQKGLDTPAAAAGGAGAARRHDRRQPDRPRIRR